MSNSVQSKFDLPKINFENKVFQNLENKKKISGFPAKLLFNYFLSLALLKRSIIIMLVDVFYVNFCFLFKVLWKSFITKNMGVLSNSLDISSLAKVSDGYTPGQILSAVREVLTERRVSQQGY